MKMTDFAKSMTVFFWSYLPGVKNMSRNTIRTYSDAFRLLLVFCRDVCDISPENLSFEKFDEVLVSDFLEWLQNERGNSVATRNLRLSAIQAFARYVQVQQPGLTDLCQRILQIPNRKYQLPTIRYLTLEQTKTLLESPNASRRSGRRDVTLMSVLYDTAARVQELCDLRPRDVSLGSPAFIALGSTGPKVRLVPISVNTAELLRSYLHETKFLQREDLDVPLFFNPSRSRLTACGISSILRKHAEKAFAHEFPGMHKTLTPQMLRNSKSVHLYQAGVDLMLIRDMIGSASWEITDRYVRADTGLHVELERVHPDPAPETLPDWSSGMNLIDILKNI